MCKEHRRVSAPAQDPFLQDGACAGALCAAFPSPGVPNGSRTHVNDVRGRCPGPLDDGNAGIGGVFETSYGKSAWALMEDGESFVKEVIQPQVPLWLPCYDFTPVMDRTVVTAPLAVGLATSGAIHSHGVTGGVYKARERIHRSVLICDY